MSGAQGPDLVGTILDGNYRITRLIGQGGMGAVYEGVQIRLERRVAIKLMARELAANTEAIARFRREAEVTSQLGHPHIVQVFDFGAAPSGEPYIVMEFLEGEDLEKRIQRVGTLPLAAASHIIRQVASALSATHAKGIVHRDLKPANVFLLSVEGETDFVKVVDFGISKVRSATTKLTAALAVMGTPNYMAPEQAEGRVGDIDARTDQWALACIAYELLAGRPPFVGENVASLLYQVIHQAPSPISQMNPGLPAGVEGVLRRALSKTQAERFQTLTEFSRAFEGAASGKVVPATMAGPGAAAAPVAAAASGAAIGRAPTMASQPGIPPVTTFSSAAGEASEPDVALPARPKRGLLFVGLGAAAALGAGAFALISRRAPGPAPAAAVVAPAPTTSGPVVAPPPPPQPAPQAVAAAAPDAGATQVAQAAPPAPAIGKKGRRSRGAPTVSAVPPPSEVPPAGVPPAGDTAPRPAWPPPQQQAAAPAWPPPQQQQASPAPAWPPPQQQAPPPPAWPPPANGAQQPEQQQPPPQKRPGIFRRMFR
jgi:serine/threonine-protein kinase